MIVKVNTGNFQIDEGDLDKIKRHSWYIDARGYVSTNIRKSNGERTILKLHRLLLDNPEGVIDHINRDKLDNRRSNLRACTQSINCYNAGMRKDNTSGYKGVTFNEKSQKWIARISYGKTRKHLGYFLTKEAAYDAYVTAAERYPI